MLYTACNTAKISEGNHTLCWKRWGDDITITGNAVVSLKACRDMKVYVEEEAKLQLIGDTNCDIKIIAQDNAKVFVEHGGENISIEAHGRATIQSCRAEVYAYGNATVTAINGRVYGHDTAHITAKGRAEVVACECLHTGWRRCRGACRKSSLYPCLRPCMRLGELECPYICTQRKQGSCSWTL